MWGYFRRKGCDFSGFQIKDDNGLTVHHIRPETCNSLHNFYGFFISSGSFKKYQLLH